MVGQIGPLVQAGKQDIAVAHLIGGVLGGLATGTVIGVLAALVHSIGAPPAWLLSTTMAFELGSAAAGDASLVRLPRRVGSQRQTPRAWTCSFGEFGGAFAWGFDLGTLLTTRLPSYSAVALPVFGVLSGDYRIALLLFALYGGSRAATTVMLAESGGEDIPGVCRGLAQANMRISR